jgi:hypothetical protein
MILGTLEEEVLPLYYTRDEAGCPGAWVRRSKRAMMTVIPRFNMGRVLFDYTRGLYLPAAQQYRLLAADAFTGARTLADWKQRVRAAWPKVSLSFKRQRPRPAARGAAAAARGRGLNGLRPRTRRVRRQRLLPGGTWRLRPVSHGLGAREGVWNAATDECTTRRVRARRRAAEVASSAPRRASTRGTASSHPYEVGLMKWL